MLTTFLRKQANNTLCCFRISKYLLSKFYFRHTCLCMKVCVCVCELGARNRKLYVSKLITVSPLHPAYLSSLGVAWKIAKCLETVPTCVNFDGRTRCTRCVCCCEGELNKTQSGYTLCIWISLSLHGFLITLSNYTHNFLVKISSCSTYFPLLKWLGISYVNNHIQFKLIVSQIIGYLCGVTSGPDGAEGFFY